MPNNNANAIEYFALCSAGNSESRVTELVEFYTNHFQLNLVNVSTASNGYWLSNGCGKLLLHILVDPSGPEEPLITHRGGLEQASISNNPHRFHVGISVPNIEYYEQKCQHRNVPHFTKHIEVSPGNRMTQLFVYDPAGQLNELHSKPLKVTGRMTESKPFEPPVLKNGIEDCNGKRVGVNVVEGIHIGRKVPLDLLEDAKQFYMNTLGLQLDPLRPHLQGLAGWWLTISGHSQIHLLSSEEDVSIVALNEMDDPTQTHLALGVENIQEAESYLQKEGIYFYSVKGLTAPQSEQLFLWDPAGNLIELQQMSNYRTFL